MQLSAVSVASGDHLIIVAVIGSNFLFIVISLVAAFRTDYDELR